MNRPLREASVKKRKSPGRSKRPARVSRAPQTSPKKTESARRREVKPAKVPALPQREPEELPDFYEETKVVLLPVNPYLVHVYWGVGPHDLAEIGRFFTRLGRRVQPVLRFFDITYIDFDGANAHSWFDIEIDLRAKNWYVHLASPARSYCLDLGLRVEGGEFHRLARSSAVEIPRTGPSDQVAERFLLVEEDFRRAAVPPAEPGDVLGNPPQPSRVSEPRHGIKNRQQPKELRIFRTAPPGENERKLEELYQRRVWERSGLAPQAPPRANPQASGKESADLTELSERNFRTGISSGRK
jgi:hypothetical protein